MIQLIGEAEKAKIMADEKTLLEDLCAYRDVLCLPDMEHCRRHGAPARPDKGRNDDRPQDWNT